MWNSLEESHRALDETSSRLRKKLFLTFFRLLPAQEGEKLCLRDTLRLPAKGLCPSAHPIFSSLLGLGGGRVGVFGFGVIRITDVL